MIRHAIGLTAAMLVVATPAAAVTLYSNDFAMDAHDFTGANFRAKSPSGEQFLGLLAQGTAAQLTLNTAGYTLLTVAFDLYAVQSLDGNSSLYGPDYFTLTASGQNSPLIDATFSNSGALQSYPVPSSPARTGAIAVNTLGYQVGNERRDSTYLLSFTFAPTSPTTILSFIGRTTQPANDESFGIDNLVVTGLRPTSAVPEASGWAMLIVGFGMVGAIARRGNRAFQLTGGLSRTSIPLSIRCLF